MSDPEIQEIKKNVYLFIEGKISGHELARRTPVKKKTQEKLFCTEVTDGIRNHQTSRIHN